MGFNSGFKGLKENYMLHNITKERYQVV